MGGRTLADRQLEAIGRAAGCVASVRVVVGHAAEAIELHLAEHAAAVGIVANPEFAELNNWWSLLRALRELPEVGPVAVLNADLLAAPVHVAAFIERAATTDAEGLLAVDLAKHLTVESMKVALTTNRTLLQIGKVGIDAPAGEYVGMLMARGAALRGMRGVLEGFVGRPDAASQWYEGAVGQTAADGVTWHVWPDAAGRMGRDRRRRRPRGRGIAGGVMVLRPRTVEIPRLLHVSAGGLQEITTLLADHGFDLSCVLLGSGPVPRASLPKGSRRACGRTASACCTWRTSRAASTRRPRPPAHVLNTADSVRSSISRPPLRWLNLRVRAGSAAGAGPLQHVLHLLGAAHRTLTDLARHAAGQDVRDPDEAAVAISLGNTCKEA